MAKATFKIFLLLIAFSTANTVFGAGRFYLADGTPVKLRLMETVSSATAQVNQHINFETLEAIKLDGVTVIPKGATAIGTVTAAQPKRRLGRGGKLDITIDYVRLADGEKAALRAVKDLKGGGHTGAMTAGIVATSLIVWPAAPFFLFMHGKNITIPEGTEITAFVNGDTDLNPQSFSSLGPPTNATGVASAISQLSLSTVTVDSILAGADITVDGKYVGSTPSKLQMMGGRHTVVVHEAVHPPRQRALDLTAGEAMSVNATRQKEPAVGAQRHDKGT